MKRVRASLTFASMRYAFLYILSIGKASSQLWMNHTSSRSDVSRDVGKVDGVVGWGTAEQRRWKDECVASGTRGDFVVPWVTEGPCAKEMCRRLDEETNHGKFFPRFPCALWQCFMKNRRHMVCSHGAWWEKFWISSLSSQLLLNLFLSSTVLTYAFSTGGIIKLFACCLGKLFLERSTILRQYKNERRLIFIHIIFSFIIR